MAGHTDIHVGTVATSAGVVTGDGSYSGTLATTGAMRISVGVERRTASAARYASKTTLAANAKNAGYDGRIGRGANSGDTDTDRSRASSRARKSGHGSIAGRLLTNMTLL